MTEEEYAEHYRCRNGVETIFFILQAYYGIKSMPVRGYEATAFKVGCKIGGFNCRKLYTYMSDLERKKNASKSPRDECTQKSRKIRKRGHKSWKKCS